MLSKMHTALSHWLEQAKILQKQYEASGDQRAIEVGRRSIERMEKQIQELEEQGAA